MAPAAFFSGSYLAAINFGLRYGVDIGEGDRRPGLEEFPRAIDCLRPTIPFRRQRTVRQSTLGERCLRNEGQFVRIVDYDAGNGTLPVLKTV